MKLTLDGNLGKSDIQGVQKVEYTDKSWGKAEGELDTATGKAWGTATFKKLVKATELSIAGGFDPKSKSALVKANGGLKVRSPCLCFGPVAVVKNDIFVSHLPFFK